MDYFPSIDYAEIEMYKQLRRKVLADQARQQVEHEDEIFDLKVALLELDDDASVQKPRKKWHGLSLRKRWSGSRESDQQRLIPQEPYSYQGTRGYGKLAAQKGQ